MGKRSYLKVGGTINAGRVLYEATAIVGVGTSHKVEFTGTADGKRFAYLVQPGGRIEPLPGYTLTVQRITATGRIEFEATAAFEHIRVKSGPSRRPAGVDCNT